METREQKNDGLRAIQREQLDKLLQEAGDDPYLRAALGAMFYIGVHQDNGLRQLILAHRDEVREDLREAVDTVIASAKNHEHAQEKHQIAQTEHRLAQQEQQLLQQEQHVTLRAFLWVLCALGFVLLCVTVAVVYLFTR